MNLYQINPESQRETVALPSVHDAGVGDFEPVSLFVQKIEHVFDRQGRSVGALIGREN